MSEEFSIPVPSVTVSMPWSALGDSPVDQLARDWNDLAMDAKAAMGHISCDGWRTEGDPHRLYCGCGVQLLPPPEDFMDGKVDAR